MAQERAARASAQSPGQSDAFVKQLASSDLELRTSALESLRTYLARRERFSDIELLKLWKGLFYCMWMCDKPRPQQQLAQELAGLVAGSRSVLAAENALPFINAFWVTMAREWVGIDVLRMNKYLYLARQMLSAALQHLVHNNWSRTLLKEYNAILERTPLNRTDPRIPNGLRYHVLDIYVDEIEKVLEAQGSSAAQDDKSAETDRIVRALLSPVNFLRQKSATKTVRQRAADTLADAEERLGVSMDDDDEDDLGKAQQAGGQNDTSANEIDEEWTGLGD